MRSVKTVPCGTQEWDFCYNPYSVISAIRSILEYGTKIWHGSLTEEQSKDIEQIQRRGMQIICPEDLRTGID